MVKTRFRRGVCIALAVSNCVALWCLVFGVGVVVARDRPLPPVPRPGNVSADPTGEQPPEFGVPPGEQLGAVYDAEKIQTHAGEDAVDWSVKSLNAPAAWAKGLTGKGVKVAVLDTGADPNHRDLMDAIKAGRDFTGSRIGWKDAHGHGTHCAGSIAARKNGWGLQGVAYECDLYVGKVLGDSGSGSVAGIRDGLLWAAAQDADVVSMSLGGGGSEAYIPVGLKACEEKGVVVLAAAGNDGNGRPVNYPAAYDHPVAVSACDIGLRLAGFSCTGSKVEVTGPGVNVRSAIPGDSLNPDGRFGDMSGTSMSTPNVAGLAALWVQCDQAAGGEKRTRPKRFRDWLSSAGNSKDLGPVGRDTSFGWGLPDAAKLQLKTPDTPPPPPTDPPPVIGVPKPVKLDETDLNEKGTKKLKDGGLSGFKWESRPDEKTPPPTAPSITHDELKQRLEGGESLVVFVKVPPDAAFPKGVVLTDPDDELEPGVYEFRQVTAIAYRKLR